MDHQDVFWTVLIDILFLLLSATLLGAIFERFKQSAMLGYLLAGTLLGPNAFQFVSEDSPVKIIAELGVTLLLFTIGLEFSFERLRKFGKTPWIIGGLQLGGTIGLGGGIAMLAGFSFDASIALGAILALSSTAIVLRVLYDRGEVDASHGRQALGILLFQDIALAPLVLLIAALVGAGSMMGVVTKLGVEVVYAGLLTLAFFLFSRFVLPRIVASGTMIRNRELPILFAIVSAIGAAVIAYQLHLSPALGAFLAGMMLGDSPVATQIRADIGALRTLFVTLFFSAIGMLADPAWIADNFIKVGLVVILVIGIKSFIVAGAATLLKLRPRHAIAAGFSVAQIGEFSFVLAGIAYVSGRENNLFAESTFDLIVAVTIMTLFVTPFLVPFGTWLGKLVEERFFPYKAEDFNQDPDEDTGDEKRVFVIGFGPAGQAVAAGLQKANWPVTVLDLNPAARELAMSRGFEAHIGDVLSSEVLEHAGLHKAVAVVITLPYYRTVAECVRMVKSIHPECLLLARSRYHRYAPIIEAAGAHVVVDEEDTVGIELSHRLCKSLPARKDTAKKDSTKETDEVEVPADDEPMTKF